MRPTGPPTAMVLGAVALLVACTGPSRMPSQTTPSPTSTRAEAPPIPARLRTAPLNEPFPRVHDLGGAASCLQYRTYGDFDGDGKTDAAAIYSSIAARPPICDLADGRVPYRASFFLGSGRRVDWAFLCAGPNCAVRSAAALCLGRPCDVSPDLDGDGRSELLLGPGAAASDDFRVYQLAGDSLRPAVLLPPGDPQVRLRPGPIEFLFGFDVLSSGGIWCATRGGSRIVIARWFQRRAPTSPWMVHETRLVLRGHRFSILSIRHHTLPAEATLRSAGLERCL